MAQKVKFTLGKHIVGSATGGILVGDFNNWDTDAGTSLSVDEHGALTANLDLLPGQHYQYRYLLNDGRWENDDSAHYYAAANGLNVENCVVFVDAKSAVTEETAGVVQEAAKSKIKTAESVKKLKTKTVEPKAKVIKETFEKIPGLNKALVQVLHTNNIDTYAKLAKTSIKKLKEILAEAGVKFETVDPTTWPKDAKAVTAVK